MASGLYSIETTFDKIWRGKKGTLPHVRTSIKNYENVIEPRIETLTAASYSKVADDIYARITAGYLEQMYAESLQKYCMHQHNQILLLELNLII